MTGSNLKEMLRGTGLSITEIARRMGMTSQNLQMYFKAEDVRTSTLERLCAALGVSIGWFYGEVKDPVSTDNSTSIKALSEELAKKNAQIDRLLGIIEAMQGVSKKGIA